jgi:adhesin/invasin
MMPIRRHSLLLFFCFAAIAACGGDSSGPSGPRPASVEASAGDGQSATVGTAVATPPAVLVRDRKGDPLPNVRVSFAVVAGGGSITGATATTGASGVAAVGSWTLGTVAGSNQLRATVTGLTPVTFTATGTPGVPAALGFKTAPSSTSANGSPLATQPVVELRDQYGNPSPQAGVTITAAIDSGGGTLGGTTSVPTDAAGAAAFTNLSITGQVGQRILSFSAAGVAPLKSGPLTLTPGPATAIAKASADSLSGTVGAALTPAPSVLVTDQSGNPVPGIVVTFAVAAGGGSATGTAAVTNASGVATVGSWILGSVAGTWNNRLTATVAGLGPVTFTASGVAAAATRLVVTRQPGTTSAVNGQPVAPQPRVQLRDQYGNDVAQAGIAVTAAIASGGGTLGGTVTVNTDATGAADFADLAITGLVGPRSLRFDGSIGGTALTPGASASFTLTAGPATTIAASSGNGQTATVGTAVAQPPTVLVTDQSGNPVSGVPVTFATSGGASVTGASQSTAATGLAAVGGWTLGTAAGPYTLTATATGLAGSPVTFTATATAGPPQQLDIVAQPASGGAQAGVVFPDQPVVRRLDSFGNVVVSPAGSITAAMAFGAGTLNGTLTVNTDPTTGLASWTDLSIAGIAGTKALRFTAGSLSVTSAPFSLAPGPGANLAMVTEPSSSVVNGNQLATQPVVRLVDAGGNPDPTPNVAVTAQLTGTPAGIALGGTTTVTTDGSGVASFSGLSLTGAIGTYTITFTASGYGGVNSAAITVTAGPPASVAANSPVSQSGRVGIAAPSRPSVVVRDMSNNPVAGVNVSFALTAGGGSISGAAQVTDAQGVATLGGWTLGPTVTTNTVTATVSGFPPVNFDVQPSFVAAQVAAGAEHSCAITVDGLAYCWGDNTTSELGDGTTTQRTRPRRTSGSATFQTVAAGRGYSCGLTASGAAWCWGANTKGQLGVGNTSTQNVPAAVQGGVSFASIWLSLAVGDPHTCAVAGNQQLYCWGSNLYGQLGNGSTSTAARTTPLAIGSLPFAQVYPGVFFTCGAQFNNTGRCWGLNTAGQLGDGSRTQRLAPTVVAGGLTFTQIAAGVTHACGLTTAGTVYCWGDNENGRLGRDSATTAPPPSPNDTLPFASLVPVPVPGLSSVVQLAAGEAHTCARTSAGQVYCWGLNNNGQLGDGTTLNRQAPTLVALPSGVTGFTRIAAGSLHTCGLTASGALYCWGDNLLGQLGDGTNTDRLQPVRVADP